MILFSDRSVETQTGTKDNTNTNKQVQKLLVMIGSYRTLFGSQVNYLNTVNFPKDPKN